jgi:hypothetical protein
MDATRERRSDAGGRKRTQQTISPVTLHKHKKIPHYHIGREGFFCITSLIIDDS